MRRGALVQAPPALPAGEPPVRPLSIVHRSNRRLNPAVTAFIALLGAAAPAPPRRRTAGAVGERRRNAVRTAGADPRRQPGAAHRPCWRPNAVWTAGADPQGANP